MATKSRASLRLRPESVMTQRVAAHEHRGGAGVGAAGSQRYLPPRTPAIPIPQVATPAPPPATAAASSTAEKAASADPTGITRASNRVSTGPVCDAAGGESSCTGCDGRIKRRRKRGDKERGRQGALLAILVASARSAEICRNRLF